MANTKSGKKRTQVKDLPKKEKELSAEEQKNVKGGQWLTSPAGSAKSATGAGALSGGVDATRQSEESYSIWPADREN